MRKFNISRKILILYNFFYYFKYKQKIHSMTDPSIFSVDHAVIRRKYTHQCILSKGKDIYLDFPCLNHLVTNILDGKKRGLQVFSNLPHDLYSKKLDQISKAAYNYFVPLNTRILSYSSRKNEDRSYDFFILYDIDGFDITLEEQISKRKLDKKHYTEAECFDVLNDLIESVYMCGRLTNEFIDITPNNIVYNEKDEHYKHKLSNLSAVVPRKLEKKFHCPYDKYHSAKHNEKTGDLLCKALVFQIGMIILQMATLEETNDLYSDANIKEELLLKRIESLKSRGFTEKLHNVLSLMLIVKEDKRITMDELVKTEKGIALLKRETFYFQGKLENAQNYSGFVKYKSKDAKDAKEKDNNEKDNKALTPHGLGDIMFFNGDCYKGTFKEGKRDGWGIWYNGNNLYICAHWENDVNKQGQLIVKNLGMLFTATTAQKTKAKGTWIPLSSNMMTNMLYYEGEFNESGDKTTGNVFYKDGSKYIGELKNDLKHGKGEYHFSPKKNKDKIYDGGWVEDKMHGEGKLIEHGKAWEVKVDKGVEISRKEWTLDINILKEKKEKKGEKGEKNENVDGSPEKKEKKAKTGTKGEDGVVSHNKIEDSTKDFDDKKSDTNSNMMNLSKKPKEKKETKEEDKDPAHKEGKEVNEHPEGKEGKDHKTETNKTKKI